MLLMLVPLGSRPRNRVVGSGRAIAHAGDATPARRWNRGEKSSASGRGATGGSGSGTIRHVPGLERFLHRAAFSRRAGQGSGLGRRGVAQLAAQDLADVGLGQLGAELDVLGLLVAGEVLARVRLDLLAGKVRFLAHVD